MSKKKTTTDVPTTITPQDLENKLRALQGDIHSRVDGKKSTIATVATGTGIVLMLIMFFLGKRAGTKRSAVVEIRRI